MLELSRFVNFKLEFNLSLSDFKDMSWSETQYRRNVSLSWPQSLASASSHGDKIVLTCTTDMPMMSYDFAVGVSTVT